MCLCQKYVTPRSVYSHAFNVVNVSAGCGKCDECREVNRNEWVNRLCFEYDANKGGCCVFLTFTYNDSHLPRFVDGDFFCSCFNHDDVKAFLRSLKNYYFRKMHCQPFKYFWASEYGKNTRRPHYHCLFYLDASIASCWSDFVEVCRHIWSKSILPPDSSLAAVKSFGFGYMFPDIRSGRYVDIKGNDRCPKIRSGVKGMVYCSKYACKDMSYYSDEISAYLASANGYKLKPFLPKHWQSNRLGYSAVDVVREAPEKAFRVGITNPLSKVVVPLPNYVCNKFLYNQVWNGRTKINERTGKLVKLYDRELSDFGKSYIYTCFLSRCDKQARKMSVFFQSLDFDLGVPLPSDALKGMANSCGISDFINYRQFLPLAFYHCFWRNYDKIMFSYALHGADGCVSDMLSDSPFMRSLVPCAKDGAFFRTSPVEVDVLPLRPSDVFGLLPSLDAVYSDCRRKVSKVSVSARVRKRVEGYETKELLTHGYPKNLC